MIVYKFGGASVKDPQAVKNLTKIVNETGNHIIIVLSAMDKMTNTLEKLTDAYFHNNQEAVQKHFIAAKEYHLSLTHDLFKDGNHAVFGELDNYFKEMEGILQQPPSMNYDFEYDRLVPYGELLSTKITGAYMDEHGGGCAWTDVRQCLKTDDNYRDAKVNWKLTKKLVAEKFKFSRCNKIITQGFIGSTENNLNTTLGREGSDYTAAILAYILNAKKLTIWKDVPGVLNADPKWFDNTIKLENLSYMDAIELAYYGATVIHPKTIQPLKKKGINLCVKSFLNPDDYGSLIGDVQYESLIPSFIFKMDQVLIHIYPHDFSFIAEENLECIFGHFARNKIKINLMQNSAISFKVCVNNEKQKINKLLQSLEQDFKVTFETGLELITIRYYDQATIDRVLVNKRLLLEQKSKTTIQMVVKDLG